MGIFEPAEIALEQVCMGIKMDHRDRAISGKTTQDRQ